MKQQQLKGILKQTTKYLLFFVLLFSWMVFLNKEEVLSAKEVSKVQEFQAVAKTAPVVQVASENPVVQQPAAAVTTPVAKTGTVNENGVYVRREPNTNADIIYQLTLGTELDLVEKDPSGWWKVNMEGEEYYVFGQFITVNE